MAYQAADRFTENGMLLLEAEMWPNPHGHVLFLAAHRVGRTGIGRLDAGYS
jgi:hypothetical protein